MPRACAESVQDHSRVTLALALHDDLRMRAWIFAVAIGIATPAVADTCQTSDSESLPPESAGCAVRPGVGALASLVLSFVALGLATRRRSTTR
jgi:hypothetical protein